MERLYKACMQIPVQFSQIKQMLDEGNYSSEDITSAMLKFVDDACFLETREFVNTNGRIPLKQELHIGYLYELIVLFLEYGLDSNLIINDETVLRALTYVDYDCVAADAARLLLENGADPNMDIDGESAFDSIDFDVIFGSFEQEDRRMYNSWVHLWLIMIGFGGTPRNGTPPLSMQEGYSFEILRNHERFDFSIEKTSPDPDGWIMHVFDKLTGEDVATL